MGESLAGEVDVQSSCHLFKSKLILELPDEVLSELRWIHSRW